MTLALTFGNIECYFKVDSSGGLTPANQVYETENPYEKLSVQAKICCAQNWKQVQKEYNYAIKIIGSLLNWTPPQEESEVGTAFTFWIESGMHEKVTQLNLSKQHIKRLPPQIKLFKNLETLDLSDNLLLSLSPDLEQLPLKEIDISGNIWMQSRLADCNWLKKKKHCKLKAFRINLDYLPEGFNPDTIECEQDLSFDNHYPSIREESFQ